MVHQIVLFYLGRSKHIAVSCTCLRGAHGYEPLASGVRLPAAQAIWSFEARKITMRESDG